MTGTSDDEIREWFEALTPEEQREVTEWTALVRRQAGTWAEPWPEPDQLTEEQHNEIRDHGGGS